MRLLFLGKTCASKDTRLFSIYEILIFDEGNNHSFLVLYFNWYFYLTDTNFPLPQVWMPDLLIYTRKLEILMYTPKFCYIDYEISANFPLFSVSNSIDIKEYQFSYPTVELAKLSMRNDYVLMTFIKSKFK